MTPTRSQKHGIVSSPLPLSKLVLNALPSSAIVKDKLIPVERVIQKYPKLKGESKAGTLACKIAREAIFGTKVMRGCTPGGSRELPGLPSRELKELKKVMFTQFPQFWKSREEFEPIWKKCLESVQQLCKRLRTGKDKERD